MTTLTVDDFPTLGFIPCPGDYEAAHSVVDALKSVTEELGEIARVARGADKGVWKGKAADAFRDMLSNEFRPKVNDAYESFRLTKNALRDWVDYMHSQQLKAKQIEREAHAAKKAADSKSEHAEKKKHANQDGDADDPVEPFRARARRLHEDYVAEGQRVAQRLKRASDIAPNEPRIWEEIGDALGDAYKEISWAFTHPKDALKKYAPLLKAIGDVCGLVGPILGVLAFVPGLQWLGAVGLAISALGLLTHYLAAAGKSGSFTKALTDKDVLMDAAGMAVGVGALKVGAKLSQNIIKANSGLADDGLKAVTQRMPRGLEKIPGLNRVEEVPHGFFDMAKGMPEGYNFTNAEMGWRAGQYATTWTGNVLTSMGTDDLIDTTKNVFTGDWGPMRQEVQGDPS